jgi:hypothetical protein
MTETGILKAISQRLIIFLKLLFVWVDIFLLTCVSSFFRFSLRSLWDISNKISKLYQSY